MPAVHLLCSVPIAAGQDMLGVLMGEVTHCLQVCGEATYVDDMKIHDMLHAALVVSSRPHAKILSVDASAAANVSPSLHPFYPPA